MLKYKLDQAGEEERQQIEKLMRNSMRLEWRDPKMLQPRDDNPKHHPSLQRVVYSDFVDDVGWVGAFLYNERTHHILDGHMRQDDALEKNLDEVPVLVIDVDQPTEDRILVFLDRIGRLSQDNDDQAEKLLADQELPDSLQKLLSGNQDDDLLLADGEEVTRPDQFPGGGLDLVLGEQYNYVVLLFKTELDWISAQDHFGLKRVRCAFSTGIGLGRVIDGGRYLERVYGDGWAQFRSESGRERLLARLRQAVEAGEIGLPELKTFVKEMA